MPAKPNPSGDAEPAPPPPAVVPEDMRRDLEDIGRTFMPFGKFGPAHFPPHGLPIYDLPVEYLGWFAAKGGFPKGRLGTLLKMVYHMKADGSDIVFEPFRRRAGGRASLRPERPKSFDFSTDQELL